MQILYLLGLSFRRPHVLKCVEGGRAAKRKKEKRKKTNSKPVHNKPEQMWPVILNLV